MPWKQLEENLQRNEGLFETDPDCQAHHEHFAGALLLGNEFGKALLLGIPASASIGGMGTIIGSPPNAIAVDMINHLSKINVKVIQRWARVMQKIPSSRLILKSKGFNHEKVMHTYIHLFEKQGITAERLDLLPFSNTRYEHLEVYNQIDIAVWWRAENC